jgi:hypothetical protein
MLTTTLDGLSSRVGAIWKGDSVVGPALRSGLTSIALVSKREISDVRPE